MNANKKLLVGVLLFVLTLTFSIPLQTKIAYAATADSEEALRSLAATLKTQNENTITGKLGDQTITFNRKATGGTTPIGLATPTKIQTYEAQNLDCGGEKARISINNSETVKLAYLYSKFKQGSGCSEEVSIQLNRNESGAISGTSAEGAGENISCESTDSGPLGWILCPIIELAASFTQFVFENFVRPFLEDVPVSAKEGEGTYEAWKNFRLIGNIVLVGTMVAVVYAQVRGDR